MSVFKFYPEVSVVDGSVDGLFRIETNSGRVMVGAHFKHRLDAERFANRWNACRKVAFPEAHIMALEDYAKRVEQLRKDAWARVQELETELAQMRASKAVAA